MNYEKGRNRTTDHEKFRKVFVLSNFMNFLNEAKRTLSFYISFKGQNV